MTVCALVPVKSALDAKTRLREVLDENETALLARELAAATLGTLTTSRALQRVVLMGDSQTVARLSAEFGCEMVAEEADRDLCANLMSAARSLGLRATDTLAIFPADIPLITPADVQFLVKRHASGVTVCPAARDGGTNALLLTPPDAIDLQFGDDSARRHLASARAAGLSARSIESPTVSLDVDTPEDLDALCRRLRGGPLYEALHRAGIVEKILRAPAVLTA